ncbi:substrate binding domain-containing protein [Pseudomonas fluorescens]|uniref:substrate binding domain-containing protein n=2 Tax=Pseudomonas TaxID=286 RepID=UPI003C1F7322
MASARSVEIEGLLRVTAPSTFGGQHLPALVAEFHRQYPAVTFELGLTDRYVDLVEERWDMAIRIGVLADSNLVARKLASVNLSICASPNYLNKHGTPRTIADLANHDCLGFTLASRTGTLFWAFGTDGSRHVPVRGSLHADSGEALVQAAMAGQGIVYGPRYMTANGISTGALVSVVLDEPLMDLGAIYAITHQTRRPAAKTRAWIDFLSRQLPALARDW